MLPTRLKTIDICWQALLVRWSLLRWRDVDQILFKVMPRFAWANPEKRKAQGGAAETESPFCESHLESLKATVEWWAINSAYLPPEKYRSIHQWSEYA